MKVHLDLRKNVRARFEGGRAGEGDTQQAEERVAAAEAVVAEFRLSLDVARAKYRNVVGLEPYNLRFPGRLSDLPKTKDESLDVAYKFNPTIRAAGADVVAAKRAFDATTGARSCRRWRWKAVRPAAKSRSPTTTSTTKSAASW